MFFYLIIAPLSRFFERKRGEKTTEYYHQENIIEDRANHTPHYAHKRENKMSLLQEQMKKLREEKRNAKKLDSSRSKANSQVKAALDEYTDRIMRKNSKTKKKSQVKTALDESISKEIRKVPWSKVVIVMIVLSVISSLIVIGFSFFVIIPQEQETEAKKAKCLSTGNGVYRGGECYVDGERVR